MDVPYFNDLTDPNFFLCHQELQRLRALRNCNLSIVQNKDGWYIKIILPSSNKDNNYYNQNSTLSDMFKDAFEWFNSIERNSA